VWLVSEVQSRWGQKKQSDWKDLKELRKLNPAKFDEAFALVKQAGKELDTKGNYNEKGQALVKRADEISQEFGGKNISFMALADNLTADHPLLPLHQSLILKSVIREAQKQGIKKLVISGSKTALMTEMLDRPGSFEGPFTTREQAQEKANSLNRGSDNGWKVFDHSTPAEQRWFASDKQGGFDVAYDTALPSIMKKLVGNEGEKWDGGVHKNAGEAIPESEEIISTHITKAEAISARDELAKSLPIELRDIYTVAKEDNGFAVLKWIEPVKGSPVFRNPDGSPKTNITHNNISYCSRYVTR
jgi:hypothetical protein